MLNWVFRNNRPSDAESDIPPYEIAKEIAATGTVAERKKLAAYEDLPPEFMYYFASDESAEVREVVAANPGTPLQADLVLAEDSEQSIRGVLATKFANIFPSIQADRTEKLAEMAFEVLEKLARDQITEVRKIVAESIKALDNVPKPVISLLARDLDDIVSIPVLEYSPLLEEQDLIDLVCSGASGERLAGIARREDLTADLIDSIVETYDELAVNALLGNESAAIPEPTFDKINDASKTVESWQSALANRVDVPAPTLIRLAKIASQRVLAELRDRSDLDPEMYAELEAAVANRMNASGGESGDAEALSSVANEAKEMEAQGLLTEARLVQILKNENFELLYACIGILADLPVQKIHSIIRMQNAKAIVGLTWRCKLSMHFAVALQERAAKIPTGKAILPASNGRYPMNNEDLAWQAELIAN